MNITACLMIRSHQFELWTFIHLHKNKWSGR